MSLVRKSYPLNDEEFEIYVFCENENNRYNNIWFKAKEIATILNYNNTVKAIENNVDIDDKIEWIELQNKVGIRNAHLEIPKNWQPRTIFINESGLNSLIFGSTKPEARKFKRWVTSEVLPSIRKTGAYVSPSVNADQLDSLIRLLQQKDVQLQESHNQIIHLSNKILEIKPRIAVMPYRKHLQHTIFIYKHKNENKYIFIRSQKRNLNVCIRNIVDDLDYELIFKRERVPNSMNILNKVKEKLSKLNVEYTATRNIISLKINFHLLTIVQEICN